jgi:hypothetical protein
MEQNDRLFTALVVLARIGTTALIRRDYLFLFRGMRPMTRLASPLSATMVDLAGDKFSSTYRL